MNINFNVVNTILTREHGEKSSFKVLDWRIDKITETTGNHYTTQVSRLIIRYQPCGEESSAPKEKICYVKVPTDGPFYEVIESMNCYNNEIIMYTKVFSQMYTIEKECFTPRLYYFDDNMTLMLKDLTQSGYKCVDSVQKFDIEHCIYALRCMAKFHALSVKLEKTVGLPEQVKCSPYCSAQAAKNQHFLLKQQMPQSIDSIPESLKRKYPDLITYLKNMPFENVINTLNHSSTSEFNVLNHGDFSINNIMFKYDKYGMVRKVKLVDLQTTFWNSPAQDLMYFFITNAKDLTYTPGKIETGNPYKQDHYRKIAVKWLEHLAEKGTLRIDEEHHSD
ncbi:uncharacterized protein LOC135834501 [Planococcus citri]|uniref:uncharacterized protein LOC135834501 n=1 Tax=Planococcus citri TaxID=170843 RepID=UPI0031F7E325